METPGKDVTGKKGKSKTSGREKKKRIDKREEGETKRLLWRVEKTRK